MNHQNQRTCLQSQDLIKRIPSSSNIPSTQDEDIFDILDVTFFNISSNRVQTHDEFKIQNAGIKANTARSPNDTHPKNQNTTTINNIDNESVAAPMQNQLELPRTQNNGASRKKRNLDQKKRKQNSKESVIKNFPYIFCSLLKKIQKKTLSKYQRQASISAMFAGYSQLFLNAMIQNRSLKTINRFLFVKNDNERSAIAKQLQNLMNSLNRTTDMVVYLEDVEQMQKQARKYITIRKKWLLQAAGNRNWDKKHKDFRNVAFVKYVRHSIYQIKNEVTIGLRKRNRNKNDLI